MDKENYRLEPSNWRKKSRPRLLWHDVVDEVMNQRVKRREITKRNGQIDWKGKNIRPWRSLLRLRVVKV